MKYFLMQVFLTAIIFSLIVKNPGSDDEDEGEDEEKPRISTDEQLLHEDSCRLSCILFVLMIL